MTGVSYETLDGEKWRNAFCVLPRGYNDFLFGEQFRSYAFWLGAEGENIKHGQKRDDSRTVG